MGLKTQNSERGIETMPIAFTLACPVARLKTQNSERGIETSPSPSGSDVHS